LPSIAQHCPALPSIAQHCAALPQSAWPPPEANTDALESAGSELLSAGPKQKMKLSPSWGTQVPFVLFYGFSNQGVPMRGRSPFIAKAVSFCEMVQGT
jgi:hypothetical protein